MIETERLILRPWREEDREPYAAMMADPEVGYWLAGTQTRDQSLAAIDRFQAELDANGFGMMAAERRNDGAFVGAVELEQLKSTMPIAPGHEIGWRLARHAWGCGYASEAARALLTDGFQRLGLSEIVAFTAVSNARSRAVMERIGMRHDASRDFDHPALAPDHPLLRHVVYVASAR
jgi:ribosomal-protein-alanine N-acetyltransferase